MIKTFALFACAVVLSAGCAGPEGGKTGPTGGGPAVTVAECRLSGPYTHDNLTVFLLHGKDKMDAKDFLTLDEAMAQNIAVVGETGDVNNLEIENLSKDKCVFVQSGDIIKGGKQDRTIRDDMILPPASGKMPVAAHCVEAGRWTRRGMEMDEKFAGNYAVLNSNGARFANMESSQDGVWSAVAKTQDNLSNSGLALGNVAAAESPTSLQLTLENDKLKAATEGYVKELSKIVENKNDAVGFAFAVNGKFVCADVYGSSALFRKMWPKLLQACASEAVGEFKKDEKFDPAKAEDIRAAYEASAQGAATDRAPAATTKVHMQKADKALRYESLDQKNDSLLHSTFMH
jgi:hypothetical protein